ncbi:uncharacterized protein LOC129272614 isoform X1 [Lytechinus pictus]|uniref:uncharacterized protein LOC129272614 isoform X1 n=2 Tax=Lytechinus pictus TaxID=7653 RepID=UPI0030B9CFC2
MANPIFFSDLDALKQRIEELEESSRVKFVVLNKDKAFGKDYDFAEKTSFRLRWEYDEDQHPCKIPFTGVPFVAVGRKTMECHQGKDRNIRQKEKYAIQAEKLRESKSKSRKKQALLQRTKKVSCPATIIIIQITRLQDIKVKENKEWTKRIASAEFRKMLAKGHKPQQRSEFYALFPKDEDHKGHPIKNEAAGLREPTIPEVVERVRSLTRGGVVKVSEMKQHIVSFLHKELHITDTLRRRYMPTNTDISNIMASVKRKAHQDPDSMCEFINMMRKRCPSDLLLHRPNSPKHPLLFCYQSTWQSRLLNRYGNQFCLLDAVHRVLEWSRFLYLLYVRTNVAYVAVGAFIVETEEPDVVREALDIFAKWNPSWMPSHFAVDVTDVQAVEACFPDYTVSLSNVHCERAWSELFSKAPHLKKEIILPMLRRIAHADTIGKYEDLMGQLLNNSDMKECSSFSSYWLPQAKRWVRCFQDESFYFTVHAAGGLDKQNEIFKYDVIKPYTNGSIKDLVAGLLNHFFPESYRKYLERNARSSPGYSHSNAQIPKFLQNRPRALVHHIKDRMQNDIPKGSIVDHGNGLFVVQHANECHTLRFGEGAVMPHCTCRDWQTHLLPCKHFCAVFRHFESWQWENMSSLYHNNPIFALDDAFIVSMETHAPKDSEDDSEARRKEALQECMDATRAINAAVKRLSDASHIISVTKRLKCLIEDIQSTQRKVDPP